MAVTVLYVLVVRMGGAGNGGMLIPLVCLPLLVFVYLLVLMGIYVFTFPRYRIEDVMAAFPITEIKSVSANKKSPPRIPAASITASSTTPLTSLVNYGSRDEMIRAMKKMAADQADGRLKPEDISEEIFTSYPWAWP